MSPKELTWPPARPEDGCALVTGASGAIGAATAKALAAQGWPVAVHYGGRRERAQVVLDAIEAAGGRGAPSSSLRCRLPPALHARHHSAEKRER